MDGGGKAVRIIILSLCRERGRKGLNLLSAKKGKFAYVTSFLRGKVIASRSLKKRKRGLQDFREQREIPYTTVDKKGTTFPGKRKVRQPVDKSF